MESINRFFLFFFNKIIASGVPLPRGLQKEKKTQMLDLSAIAQFELNDHQAREKAKEGSVLKWMVIVQMT
jgi:hypothetical protein